MTKESIYELQKIDCNCNDCLFLGRDFDAFAYWEKWNKDIQQDVFDKKKAEAFRIADECEDPKGKETLLYIANKMKFIFDREHLISYGHCSKFDKPVTFFPNTCQLETQQCFHHRKDVLVITP